MTHPRRLALAAALALIPAGLLPAQGFTPADSVKRMKPAPGFAVSLVAHEPEIRQPINLTFDQRGRLWVTQYLQYPNPNGLKAVSVDQFLRTEYDRVPQPPPKGPKGNDRITICEDTDGDGQADRFTDFVSGLNLCTGMAIGHGGVFVMQSPYLLFYPDKDGDDRPDGDPEVLLSGFGMQDAHAYANSLQWGPDGWLYGVQGSTVTAKIRGIEFQQGIWRYHPLTKQFELFSEGGGNTWGLDFDRHGHAITSTNYGNSVGLHQVQGAYYVKGFTKHGPLHNPHTYGYFEHLPHEGQRGGHVTIAGLVYQGGAFPTQFDGRFIGPNLLSNVIYWHELIPTGSTFKAKYVGTFLEANDTWFRPVDAAIGPDGAYYLADWYDRRANHVDPVDNWDKTNGRVYRIAPTGRKPIEPFDLGKMTSADLVRHLGRPNVWHRREARRLLADRRDPAVTPLLWAIIDAERGPAALEATWALASTGGFDDAAAVRLLVHPNDDVRAWAVRLAGDAKAVSPAVRGAMLVLARTDPSVTVRCQLACTAKRLPAADGLALVRELLARDEDAGDPFVPMLLWWAVEDKAVSDRDRVLSLLDTPAAWRRPIVEKFLTERLARRYAAEGGSADWQTLAKLLTAAPASDLPRLTAGIEKALEGRRLDAVPEPLRPFLAKFWNDKPTPATVRVAVRLGSAEAYERAVAVAADPQARESDRLAMIELLGQVGRSDAVTVFLRVLTDGPSDTLRGAALNALQPFADARVAPAVLAGYAKLPAALRAKAQALLLGRPLSAGPFLQAVDAGRIDKASVSMDLLRTAVSFSKPDLTKLIEKHWGKVGPQPAGEKIARIRALNHAMNQAKGDAVRGKELFTKTCATCHTLFGEGQKIGPELTGVNRKNRMELLTNVIDPGAMIRPEYVAFKVATTDGRLLTGLVAEQNDKAVTLLEANNTRTVVPRDQIDEMGPSPQSLMPEKLLDQMYDQDVRDLFAYLQSDGPAAPAGKPGADTPPAPKANAAKKLRVCLVSGSLEYHSDESLAKLQKYLEANYPVECVRAFRKTDTDIPGLEQLESCDAMLLFTRRLTPSPEQLERVRKFCRSGKAVVGVRTASHAFQNWLEIDKEVFGGDYKNHYGHELSPEVKLAPTGEKHPVLTGITPFTATGGLYKNPAVAKDVQVLLTGTIPEHTEPVAWVRTRPGGGRTFYTSLGHPKDFDNPAFVRLLVNGLFWSAGREVPTFVKP
jgi:putative membrane-bound dehydrogenase-like protein